MPENTQASNPEFAIQERAFRMANLIVQQWEGSLSDEDLEELTLWLQEDPQNLALRDRIGEDSYLARQLQQLDRYDLLAAREKAAERLGISGKVVRFHWKRWVAVAAVFIMAIAGTYWLVNRREVKLPQVAQIQDIKAPEKNRATITLPDGKTIMLDTVPNGTLIAGIARKTAEGKLVFEGKASDVAYIIASNPRNSKAMFIELPDHTRVWLNADTKLQYPTNYNEKDRLVTLNGEAYFEVKHNAQKPFRVSAREHTIEDIGTAFNVKAYADEGDVKTTLIEGVVKINHSVSLKPGQQYSGNTITNANIDEVMAWKNGSFYLDGRELGTVANELGRWYDVEVVFNDPGVKHSIVFGGEMGRGLSLLKVMEVLKDLKVNCTLEGKKLMIE